MNQPAKRWIVEQLATHSSVRRGPLGRVWRFVSRDVWLADLERASRLRRWLYRVLRVLYLTARSFVGDRCGVRASALTYTTVLSLVPLLAFSFAILKGLGIYGELREQRIDPYLDQLFGDIRRADAIPLPSPIEEANAAAQQKPALVSLDGSAQLEPEPTVEAATPLIVPEAATGAHAGLSQLRATFDHVLNLVDRTDVKALGAVGLMVLLLATLRLLSTIEASFNEIWGVRRARRWVRQLSDYLTMVVVTPLLLAIAVGVTTAAQNAGVVDFVQRRVALGLLMHWLVQLAPILISWLVFTLLYLVMPNRRTKITSALLGGLVAAVLWQLVLVLHIAFQVGVANYNAIYAGFAALPIFLVWIQLSWTIVLFGAELAYAHESEREYHGYAVHEQYHFAFEERIALRVMTRMCDAFLAGQAPRTTADLAASLGTSPRTVEEVLSELVRGGLVAPVESTDHTRGPAYLPSRDPSRITVIDVLETLRGEGLDGELAANSELDRLVDRAKSKLDEESRTSAHNRTLRELVEDARRREVHETGAEVAEPRTQTS